MAPLALWGPQGQLVTLSSQCVGVYSTPHNGQVGGPTLGKEVYCLGFFSVLVMFVSAVYLVWQCSTQVEWIWMLAW